MKLHDALMKVFAEQIKDPAYRIHKHRYLKNKLSIEKQIELVSENGYKLKKEAVWMEA